MKYKQIIQELRESQDPNVQVFLNDVENMTKLSSKEKKELLTRLQNPGVIETLVNNYIPMILRVAYANSLMTNAMSLLDMVGEGVIGAHNCLKKYQKLGRVSDRLVRASVINKIKKAVCNKACPFSVCRFAENDPRLYVDVNYMWSSYNRKTPMPDVRMDLLKDRFQWVRNSHGIRVKQCCASCAHKDLTRSASKRYCSITGKCVNPCEICPSWEMNEQMKIAGLVH